jgi:DNA repair protein RadC
MRPSQAPRSRIKDLPVEEQPRERLLRNGSQALSDGELVAILLRTGRPGVSAIELGRRLLARCGGAAGLLGLCARALRQEGLGPAKAATVLAAVELARRLARARLPERRPLTDPSAVANYLGLRYLVRDQEVMGALFLDTRNRLLGESEVFRGTLNRAAVEPRALLKQALLRDAAGLVLFHTHPSGDPAPSAEDLGFTRRMAEAGEIVGIRMVDHLILGSGGRWVSLRRRGGW